MKPQPRGGRKLTRLSPLYTSKSSAFVKRTIIEQEGKDKDGAYRVTSRKDAS